MAKRISLQDATNVEVADDIDNLVSDKRADWRATTAKGRRRQRQYKKRLTQELIRHLDDDAWGAGMKPSRPPISGNVGCQL